MLGAVLILTSVFSTCLFLGAVEKRREFCTDVPIFSEFVRVMTQCKIEDTESKRGKDGNGVGIVSGRDFSRQNLSQRAAQEVVVAFGYFGQVHRCLCPHHVIYIVNDIFA